MDTDIEQVTDETAAYYQDEPAYDHQAAEYSQHGPGYGDQEGGSWDGQAGYIGYDGQTGGEHGMYNAEATASSAAGEGWDIPMLVGFGVSMLMGEGIPAIAEATVWAAELIYDSGGPDPKAWANEDHEDRPEEGALEIEARLDTPVNQGGAIQITGTNWRGLSHAKVRALKARGGTIQELGLNLRITVDTPHGVTHCEVSPQHMDSPTVPEKDNLQKVMIWLITGQWENLPDHMAVVSSAAALGTYMMQKPVSELHFD